MKPNIHKSWYPVIGKFAKIPLSLRKDIREMSYQPIEEYIFKPFETPVNKIKVVILGTEPYTTPINTGYAFSKLRDKRSPVLLKNIEMRVLSSSKSVNGSGEIDLLSWVDQGIFLLNTALTVETGNAGSHLNNWRSFTERVIKYISRVQPCIWLLWGKNAQSFSSSIYNKFIIDKYDRDMIEHLPTDRQLNYVLNAAHPASKEFLNCDHFYITNRVLGKNSFDPIIY